MLRLRVKEVATAKGYTMSGLSRASDVSFKTVKRLFREPHSDVNASTLEKHARTLGVTMGDLVEILPDDDT
jgi:DNA-binding Xre family transcriptional regulator